MIARRGWFGSARRGACARRALLGVCLLAPLVRVAAQEGARDRAPVVVASKPFGESFLLAEMFAQLLEQEGLSVTRRLGLGATEVAFSALRSSAIDVYPEYTGTGLLAVLRDSMTDAMREDPRRTFARVATAFEAQYGVRWLPPLGFENGYAIAVRRATAEQYALRTISDLARAASALDAGFTSDFIGRPDGFAGLQSHYALTPRSVRPLAPAVKYEALASGAVDVIDGYATDGLLARFDLVTLRDDRRFFPPYEAAALVSPRVVQERPEVIAILTRLSGRLTEADMRRWNQRLEVDQAPIPDVARQALGELGVWADSTTRVDATSAAAVPTGLARYLWNRRAETWRLTREHLMLVSIALAAAMLVAVPLGVLLTRTPQLASGVLQLLGVAQTIPSLALLAFLIPIMGIGVAPALVALWVYALLPMVRATYSGVASADPEAVAASEALGMTPWQRLWWVQVPLATPALLAGVRTAAVITVGAATLAAFIGAGGLGEPIVTGLGLADSRLVLSGALPAALLAVVVDLALGLVERAVTPAFLQRSRSPRAA
jgi:osmoprotectant transport system permease protein